MSFIFRLIFIIMDFGLSLHIVFNSLKAMDRAKRGELTRQEFLEAKRGFYNSARISIAVKLLYWFLIPEINNVMQILISASLIAFAIVFVMAILYTLPLHLFYKKFQKTRPGLYFNFLTPPISMTVAMLVLAWFTIAPVIPLS